MKIPKGPIARAGRGVPATAGGPARGAAGDGLAAARHAI